MLWDTQHTVRLFLWHQTQLFISSPLTLLVVSVPSQLSADQPQILFPSVKEDVAYTRAAVFTPAQRNAFYTAPQLSLVSRGAHCRYSSSVSILTRLRAGRSAFGSRQRIFFFADASRPTLGPTQPPIQWELIPWGYSGRVMKLTIHLRVVRRLRMHRAIPPPPIRLQGVVLI